MRRIKLEENQLRALVREIVANQEPLGDQKEEEKKLTLKDVDGVKLAGLIRKMIDRRTAFDFLKKFGYDESLRGKEQLDNIAEIYEKLAHGYGSSSYKNAEREATKLLDTLLQSGRRARFVTPGSPRPAARREGSGARDELIPLWEKASDELRQAMAMHFIGWSYPYLFQLISREEAERIIHGKHLAPGKADRARKAGDALAMFANKRGAGGGMIG